MEEKKMSLLKKMIIGIIVAVAVAAAGYFGLDISEKQVMDAVAPVVESVLGNDGKAPESTPEVTPAQ